MSRVTKYFVTDDMTIHEVLEKHDIQVIHGPNQGLAQALRVANK